MTDSVSPVQVADDVVVTIQDTVTWVMRDTPTEIAYDTDAIDAVLNLLPDPEAFDEVSDYLDSVDSALDLDGYQTHEALEACKVSMIYTADLHTFFRENEDVCDEAVNEYGGFSEVMTDCESVSDVICQAAEIGHEYLWRCVVSEIVWDLNVGMARLREDFDI